MDEIAKCASMWNSAWRNKRRFQAMDMIFLRSIERKQEGIDIEMKFLGKSWNTEFVKRYLLTHSRS
jgi:hypothetical protein